jgi:transposase
LPQIVIGLAVTRGGIPVRCWAWPGNTADAATVDEVQKDLAGWKLSRVVWVVDRGFAGEKQRHDFQRGGGHVIVGEKLRGADKVNQEALKRPGRFKTVRDNLEVKEVTVGEGSAKRRFVVVRNPEQAARDETVRARLLARLEDGIEHVNRSKKGHTKAVCALKSHRGYGKYVRELKNGKLQIDRGKVKADARLDGKYLISTTDPTLSAEDVALGYKQLLEVERAFRTLKTTLELRPLHHRLPERIRAHVLLCWLALLLVRVTETETGMSWDRIREAMEDLSLIKLCAKDGRVEMLTDTTDEQRNILKTLDVKHPSRIRDLAQTPQNL